MAVINCPQCNNKISDKAKTCANCHLVLDELDTEQLTTIRRVNTIQKSQRIMTFSFIAMLFFCGGFLYYYAKNVQPGTLEYYLSTGAILVGFVSYIVTRIQLLILKRKLKSS